MRPMYAKRIANPSPERIQVSRPKASIPNSATYEYKEIAKASARGFAGLE